MEKKEIEEIIGEAQDLYNEGKWQESKEKLLKVPDEECNDRQLSRKYRILGWDDYYLGKKKIEDPRKVGTEAVKCFNRVCELRTEDTDISSALAGLPLVYQYLLGESEKAIEFAKKRAEEAPDEKTKAVALNSLGCIQRDSGLILGALESFDKAAKIAREAEDYRTEGHAQNNRAVTLMKIIPCLATDEAKQGLRKEAKTTFRIALGTYEKTTGQSAEFHKKRVQERLKELEEF